MWCIGIFMKTVQSSLNLAKVGRHHAHRNKGNGGHESLERESVRRQELKKSHESLGCKEMKVSQAVAESCGSCGTQRRADIE